MDRYIGGRCVENPSRPRTGRRKHVRKKKKKECLVWREAIIVDEIAAHPPDFAEFLIAISSKDFKSTTLISVKKRVVLVI